MGAGPPVARRAAGGVLVVDKPTGMTSAVAVDVVRARLGTDRVGHGGTLDPIATGVLPMAIGAAVKLAGFLLGDDKAYVADAVLGTATDTLDRAGAIIAEQPWQHVTEAAMRAALAARVGEHDQMPPMYSAIKIAGERLHARARRGEDVPRAARRVRIDSLELVAFDPPRLRVAIACGKGTYVRSLIADLAADVGTVAHLAELRRTRAGRFAIDDAHPILAVSQLTPLLPIEQITGLPDVVVPDELMRLVLHAVQIDPARLGAGVVPAHCQLVDAAGTLVAVARVEPGMGDRQKLVYDRVFPELFGDA